MGLATAEPPATPTRSAVREIPSLLEEFTKVVVHIAGPLAWGASGIDELSTISQIW